MELFTPWHLFILAIVALVLFFGWKQLPDMARSLGRSLRVFKTEIKGMSDDDEARKRVRETDVPASEPVRSQPAALEAPKVQPRPRPVPGPAAPRSAAGTDRPAGTTR